ncbi:MAG: hypothetical protein JSU01_13080 [Bacteroidetes bacterium]|nr:hypothetical protein [Bacteroidota bacterium]
MKFIGFFIAAVMAVFALQFSTASAATKPVVQVKTSKTGSSADAAQHHRVHRRMHLRRIHRHH